jgi:AAA family ATP:ADP antiporter
MGLLTVFTGSALYQLVPIIAPIVLGVVVMWILSVFGLSKRFTALTAQAESEKKAADAAKAAAPAAAPAAKATAQVGN